VFHNLEKRRRRRLREGKIKLSQVNASGFACTPLRDFRLTMASK
jgi:hypothetical protein